MHGPLVASQAQLRRFLAFLSRADVLPCMICETVTPLSRADVARLLDRNGNSGADQAASMVVARVHERIVVASLMLQTRCQILSSVHAHKLSRGGKCTDR